MDLCHCSWGVEVWRLGPHALFGFPVVEVGAAIWGCVGSPPGLGTTGWGACIIHAMSEMAAVQGTDGVSHGWISNQDQCSIQCCCWMLGNRQLPALTSVLLQPRPAVSSSLARRQLARSGMLPDALTL